MIGGGRRREEEELEEEELEEEERFAGSWRLLSRFFVLTIVGNPQHKSLVSGPKYVGPNTHFDQKLATFLTCRRHVADIPS